MLNKKGTSIPVRRCNRYRNYIYIWPLRYSTVLARPEYLAKWINNWAQQYSLQGLLTIGSTYYKQNKYKLSHQASLTCWWHDLQQCYRWNLPCTNYEIAELILGSPSFHKSFSATTFNNNHFLLLSGSLLYANSSTF